MFLERLGTKVTALRFGYFPVNNHTLGRFYLLPKIHKRLHNVPGRPDISSFLDFHLKLGKEKEVLYSGYVWLFEKDFKSFSLARWPYFMHNRFSGSLSCNTSGTRVDSN